MKTTPHRPSTHSTVHRSIQWGAIAPHVEATSALLPMKITVSPTVRGAAMTVPNTAEAKPVLLVDTAPMSTQVTLCPTEIGKSTRGLITQIHTNEP